MFCKHNPSHTPYLLTPWCRVLLEKLTGLQLVKKFPAFYGTRRFITALTNLRHPSLSWASPIQSIYLHPTSCRSILILSTHLHVGLPSGLFLSGFPTKTLYTPLSSPIRATCPAHLHILLQEEILGHDTREVWETGNWSTTAIPSARKSFVKKCPHIVTPVWWHAILLKMTSSWISSSSGTTHSLSSQTPHVLLIKEIWVRHPVVHHILSFGLS